MKIKEIQVFCPECCQPKFLKIPSKIDTKRSGIFTISIPAGHVCSHSFQVYLDSEYNIRGYQKVDLEIGNIEYFESDIDEEGEGEIRKGLSTLFKELMKQLKLVVNDQEILGTGLFTMDGRVLYSSIPQYALFNTIRELEMRSQAKTNEILKMMIELKNHQKVYAEIIEMDERKFIFILLYSRMVNFTLGSQIMKEFSIRIKKLIAGMQK